MVPLLALLPTAEADNFDVGSDYLTVQEAVDAAEAAPGSGHTIRVFGGAYTETIDVPETMTVEGQPGFATVLQPDVADDGFFKINDPAVTLTVRDVEIDGQFKSRGILLQVGGVVLERVAIRDTTNAESGGAVRVEATATNTLLVRDSSFTGSIVTGNKSGAAIAVLDGDLTVEDSTFTGGVAGDHGGAVLFDGTGDLLVTGSTFAGNVAGRTGGAVFVDGGDSIQLLGNEFFGNESQTAEGGGALRLRNFATLAVHDNTFVDNIAGGGQGGGAILQSTGSGDYHRNVFCRNKANDGGAFRLTGGVANVDNGVFLQNVALSDGAAIYVAAGLLTLDHASIATGAATAEGHATFSNTGAIVGLAIENTYAGHHGAGTFAVTGDLSTATTTAYSAYEDNLGGDYVATSIIGNRTSGTLVPAPTVDACDPMELVPPVGSTLLGNGLLGSDIGAFGGPNTWPDDDGDTFIALVDCDDDDPDANPAGTEVAGNEVDEDCDGTVLCYEDLDLDGVGTIEVASDDDDCDDPRETTATGDCDDADATVLPGATEGVGDEVDQDCDGVEACWVDADDDGARDVISDPDGANGDADCDDPTEALDADPIDCDELDPDIHPGATEGPGDNVDQDCDGVEDCYQDNDDDGARNAVVDLGGLDGDGDCDDVLEGLASDPLDCDDGDFGVFPGAIEVAGDDVDQDCDGLESCFVDADDDGARTAVVVPGGVDCADPGEGHATDPIDCDDADAGVSPLLAEVPGDHVDEDCDQRVECFDDADDDGARLATVFVTAPNDTDCLGVSEGEAGDPLDCDDTDGAVFPGALEVAGDEVDQDCDGVEDCYPDADGDGARAPGVDPGGVIPDADCDDPGERVVGDPIDCDDADPAVGPGSAEVVGNGLDEDCSGGELCYEDLDGDGAGSSVVIASIDLDCADPGEAADASDPCPVDPLDDQDGDGVCDSSDPCPLDAPDDTDGDGVCDSADVCPGSDDGDDPDLDGVPSGCDLCPFDALDDSDADGSCDSQDLCPGSPDYLDADSDGVPNGCEVVCYGPGDADADGVLDDCDVCPLGDDLDDGDGDGIPAACDPGDPGLPPDTSDTGTPADTSDTGTPAETADTGATTGDTSAPPTPTPGERGVSKLDTPPDEVGCGCATGAPTVFPWLAGALLLRRRR